MVGSSSRKHTGFSISPARACGGQRIPRRRGIGLIRTGRGTVRFRCGRMASMNFRAPGLSRAMSSSTARDGCVRDLGRVDWADWDSSGDLLLARAGKLFRTPVGSDSNLDLYAVERELIDLSGLVFEAREPVPEAERWAGPPPHGSLASQPRADFTPDTDEEIYSGRPG